MYIIDGHNLIPCLPGGSLREIDDEEMLIGLLQAFARETRKTVDVFFDGAPPGKAGERRYGTLRAHFVSAETTADEAIRRYLKGQGGRARNVVVISNDRQVQVNARALGASVVSSDDFARQVMASQAKASVGKVKSLAASRAGVPLKEGAKAMSPKELDHWLDLFGVDPAKADAPIHPARDSQAPAQALGETALAQRLKFSHLYLMY